MLDGMDDVTHNNACDESSNEKIPDQGSIEERDLEKCRPKPDIELTKSDENDKELILRRLLLSRHKELSEKGGDASSTENASNAETKTTNPIGEKISEDLPNHSTVSTNSEPASENAKSLRSSKRWEAYQPSQTLERAAPLNPESEVASRPDHASGELKADPPKPRERKRKSGWDVSNPGRTSTRSTKSLATVCVRW